MDFNLPALVLCFLAGILRSALVSSRGLSGLPPLLFLQLRAAGTWSAGSKIFRARFFLPLREGNSEFISSSSAISLARSEDFIFSSFLFLFFFDEVSLEMPLEM